MSSSSAEYARSIAEASENKAASERAAGREDTAKAYDRQAETWRAIENDERKASK